MTTAEQILTHIQESLDKFDASIPAIQRQMFDELVKELRDLDTRGGHIIQSVNNLQLIGRIKNSLEKIIITKSYIAQVDTFLDAFHQVTALQNKYFRDFNAKFKPTATLKIIEKLSIDTTITRLTETGLGAAVTGPITTLLQNNATTGGKITDLYETLRTQLIGQEKVPGSLQRYTQQITTDSLNQFSANYHKSVTQDLGYEWFRYSGLTKTTSREFCIWLRKKEWVHKSEFAEIIKGHIDGHNCAIYAKTGLPYGMYPDTNVDNLVVVRGGWGCGDQLFGVPTALVPVAVRNSIAA